MGTGRVVTVALSAFAAIIVIAVPSAAQRSNPFAIELLEAHNEARDAVGVPRLAWSNRLAREAQEWAQELARQGRMVHADRSNRNGAGENLWMGSAGRYSAQTMVDGFIAEQRHFTSGTFPQVSTTGNWRDVGHYTQVIWRDTREVGCAVAPGEHYDFLVCRYFPAGNVYNQTVF